jgi:hypothetical protein
VVGYFGSLWRSKIFRNEIGRQIYEVRKFGKFCDVREVRKDWDAERFGGMFSPVINVFCNFM